VALALTLTLSPGEREWRLNAGRNSRVALTGSGFWQPDQSGGRASWTCDGAGRRRAFLPLVGERAGVRAGVATNSTRRAASNWNCSSRRRSSGV